MKRVHAILLGVSLLLASPSFGAITHQTSTGACAAAAASVTFSATVAAGSNTIMVGGATSQASPLGGVAPTGIAFNGGALTIVTSSAIINSTDNVRAELWYRKSPDITTANVVATWSSGLAKLCAGVVILDGVEPTGTPHRTAQTNAGTSGTTASLSMTTVAGDWTVDAIGSWLNSSTGNENAGQTLRVMASSGTDLNIDMSTEEATTTTTATSFTLSNGDYWAYSGVPFIPAASGATPATFIQLNGTQ